MKDVGATAGANSECIRKEEVRSMSQIGSDASSWLAEACSVDY